MWYFDINDYLSRNKIIFEIFQPTPSTGLVPVQESLFVQPYMHQKWIIRTYNRCTYQKPPSPSTPEVASKFYTLHYTVAKSPKRPKSNQQNGERVVSTKLLLLRLPSWATATANDSIHHQHKKRSRSSSFEVNDDFFTAARWLVARCNVSEPLPPHTNCILLHSAVWHTTHP